MFVCMYTSAVDMNYVINVVIYICKYIVYVKFFYICFVSLALSRSINWTIFDFDILFCFVNNKKSLKISLILMCVCNVCDVITHKKKKTKMAFGPCRFVNINFCLWKFKMKIIIIIIVYMLYLFNIHIIILN